MKGALLVAGTGSDVGKSLLVAGMCRWLHRQGVAVAPFKAQNMALNSAVTPDGSEIGRAQASQAAAAGVAPEAAMNPVLIKPTGERSSQVVVMGQPAFDTGARDYPSRRAELWPVVLDALADLRHRFDVVVCEGAGSPTEINLRPYDLANMGLARAAHLPVVVVGDIDRGGVFAALHGSIALLDPADQALVAGTIINRFRGDRAILAPGIVQLEALLGRPNLGVVPHVHGLWLDAEDSLALDRPMSRNRAHGGDVLDVAVVRLPRLSNHTDVDALVAEPGVRVRFTAEPGDLARADLAILPGSKNTVGDLAWVRQQGLDAVLAERASTGRPLLAVCGGYQMLGTAIDDPVESGAGEVAGLGVLPVTTVFEATKVLGNRNGRSPRFGTPARGYEIRHGRVRRHGGVPWLVTDDGREEGCAVGAVLGTSWHGLLENDDLRRALLADVAAQVQRAWRPGTEPFAAVRERQFDTAANLVADHLDEGRLEEIIERGAPAGMPVVPPGGAPAPRRPSDTEATALLREHGDTQVAPGAVDLAVNVLDGPPSWLRERLTGVLDDLAAYPDDGPARRAAADRHGRDPDEVVVLDGAAEAFWLLTAALRPRHAACVHPGFTEPEAALRSAGVRVSRVLRSGETWSLDAAAVPDDADLVVLGRPDNPTGVTDPVDVVARLCRPGRTVVVDEAFADFLPDAAGVAGRADLPGLVAVRSLTKLWGLAGLRVGYLVAPLPLATRLRAVRQPWSANRLALEAITAVCAAEEKRRARAEVVGRDRDHLVAALRAVEGLYVWDATANFVLVRAPIPDLRDRLLSRGFAVRRGETFPGLDAHHVRIAVRSPDVTAALAAAIEDVLDPVA